MAADPSADDARFESHWVARRADGPAKTRDMRDSSPEDSWALAKVWLPTHLRTTQDLNASVSRGGQTVRQNPGICGSPGREARMGRFYFHVRMGDELIPDDEGRDLPDLSAALREAQLAARELLADAIKAGQDQA